MLTTVQTWRRSKKMGILVMVALVGFLGPLASAIYLPALVDVRAALNTDINTINASVACYVLFSGLGPLVWAPISERHGRRVVYLLSTLLFFVASIVCALSKHVTMFIIMRILQSSGSSAAMVVGAGSIADLFDMRERGTAMGLFLIGPLVGPITGSIIGGVINEYLGWQWIFWTLAILSGLILVASYFFLPETYPAKLNNLIEGRGKRHFPNPFRPLYFLRHPAVLMITLYPGIIFGVLFLLLTLLSETYAEKYLLSSAEIGFCYGFEGAGSILGTIVGGVYTDYTLRKRMKAHGGDHHPEMRLHSMWIGAFLVPIGCLTYGWLLYFDAHFLLPLIGHFLFGFGMNIIITTCNTYLVDAYSKYSASITSCGIFVRNVLATITPLFALTMRQRLGDGWMMTIWGAITGVAVVLPVLVLYRGAIWRGPMEAK
ncbi:MFS general substrate transporter [Basidiobolus meristosporus CBS 931.73]|uniref:MFS general substrate transporter n=1 Tax=Basidiobolus meristosporus CBS 931.73 TaxID=1314790 RepID=A0A1Y1VRX1_9FUNG|nr:MFS general substrate transporter [Basidiobolus meristosporus CBS 931.73]|eukprot:ORX63933.1 MFS general substrate transporter [Basidiobolus meristosporus CBS 931.73]